MRDAFVRRLTQLAERDPRVFLITADLGFGVLGEFAQRFPRQYLNAGIAEQNMTGLATGLALEGKIVYTYSIGNFPTLRCLEQIRNGSAYHGANVKIVAVGGGFSYGPLGISHHATEDLAILRSLPDITVMAPGTRWEAEEATEAIAGTPGTCYLRLDKSAGEERVDREPVALGRARTLRDGDDVTLISTGGILCEVQKAAASLATYGIQARVLSVHTLKPIDPAPIIDACLHARAVVTVEEHTVHGGLGSAVAEICFDAGVRPRQAERLGLRAGFSSIVGSQEYLRSRYGLDSVSIERCVWKLLNEGQKRGTLRLVARAATSG
jgi:transketolase